MNYVFVFLGEFGYELINWQGVVRHIAKKKSENDNIICCSRKGLEPFYEHANLYIDISEVPLYKKSLACVYHALPSSKMKDIRLVGFITRKIHNFLLKKSLKTYINKQLNSYYPKSNLANRPQTTFIFSDSETEVYGVHIGSSSLGAKDGEKFNGDIYDNLDYRNNVYKKIIPNFDYKDVVEKKLGIPLETPFILCQSRICKIRNFSPTKLDIDELITFLAHKVKVVLLTFNTGRDNDSFSIFSSVPNAHVYIANNFTEQAILMTYAKNCLFFTEGDFGSHIYLPPFLGKDVFAVAPDLVYQLKTSPIEFWNKNVFKFGGQIKAVIMEDIIKNKKSMENFINDKILG